jgi:hypothetical protein
MTADDDTNEDVRLRALADKMTVVQQQMLIAMAQTPPDRVDPAHQYLHHGTRGLLIERGVLDDLGYLTEFGVRAGLAFADDDDVAAQYAAWQDDHLPDAAAAASGDVGPGDTVGVNSRTVKRRLIPSFGKGRVVVFGKERVAASADPPTADDESALRQRAVAD